MPTIDASSNNRPIENGQLDSDMLDQSNLSMDQIIRCGQDALTCLRGIRTWANWLEMGAALCVGRTEAMYVAQANTRFDDGRLGESFLTNHKAGSTADAAARDSAIVCSIALQFGANPETIRRALCRDALAGASGPLSVALDMLAVLP